MSTEYKERTPDVTLKDVRANAMSLLKDLREGKIELDVAKAANSLLATIIDTAKTEVSYLNALPKQVKDSMNFEQVKQVGSSIKDADAELDESLASIKSKEHSYE